VSSSGNGEFTLPARPKLAGETASLPSERCAPLWILGEKCEGRRRFGFYSRVGKGRPSQSPAQLKTSVLTGCVCERNGSGSPALCWLSNLSGTNSGLAQESPTVRFSKLKHLLLDWKFWLGQADGSHG